MKVPSFFAELRRRRVFRVAVAYLVVAIALLEAADIIVPALDLPAWTVTLVVVLALLGFPVAVALGWAFDLTPEGVVRTDSLEDATGGSPGTLRPSAPRLALAALVALVAAVGGWYAWQGRSAPEVGALDANLVAVLPFRVSAGSDLAYLREGMLDLVAASLSGTDGLRAADPRSTLSVWRRTVTSEQDDLPPDSALLVARRLGAGQVLLGGVVETPVALTLTAELRDAASGRVRAQARVEGAADSLTLLVDRLARQLLVLGAGERDERVSLLAEVSMPALRSYLQGRAAYRYGRYAESVVHYSTALGRDTTFVLAALGLLANEGWSPIPSSLHQRARALAWEARDRLSTPDRLELIAVLGPSYPEISSGVELIEAARRATEAAPDRAELWHLFGDRLFHTGPAAGMPDAHLRARHAFDRALALDPAHASAMLHRAELAAFAGDTATVSRLARQYLARDSVGETADEMRWLLAYSRGDQAGLARFRAALDADLAQDPTGPAYLILTEGVDLTSGEHAIAAMERAALEPRQRAQTIVLLRRTLARNRGQPARAEQAIREAVALDPENADRTRLHLVIDALFWEGDAAAAAAAARELRALESEPAPQDAARRLLQRDARCWNQQWRLRHGDTTGAAQVIRSLAGTSSTPPNYRHFASFCSLLLEAQLAAQLGQADAPVLLERLDSVARSAPTHLTLLLPAANLTLARLFVAQGQHARALAAVRRRPYAYGYPGAFLSTALREEGRLAVLTGDREGAIRAYRRYLAFRTEPESALQPELERVRAELGRLEGEHTR